MSRRKRQFPKQWKIDPKHESMLVGRFVGMIMLDGKRAVAERVIYDSFEIIREKTKQGGLNVFEQAVKNLSPLVQLKSRRIGGATYQVPVPITGERRQTLALRWMRDVCRKQKGKPMAQRLANEIMLAANKEGSAMKKRDETHRMAEANKAFAHFA